MKKGQAAKSSSSSDAEIIGMTDENDDIFETQYIGIDVQDQQGQMKICGQEIKQQRQEENLNVEEENLKVQEENQKVQQLNVEVKEEERNYKPEDEIIKKRNYVLEIQMLEEEIKRIPKCSEQQILQLILLVVDILGQKGESKDYSVSQEHKDKMQQSIVGIKQILQQEEIDSQEIDSLIKGMSLQIQMADWQKLENDLRKLLRLSRPLNISEMKILIEKADEAAERIRGREVILLLGGTGAGKSTTIYFLTGQEIKFQKVMITENNYIESLLPVLPIKNEDLKKIKISHQAVSETRYITPVQIDLRDIGARRQQVIYICDSPGFGDTAGPEVDIANGIGIIKAIQGCSSVRPLILASYLMVGDRGEGMKRLAHLIITMFRGQISDYLSSFSYYFTKFPDNVQIYSFLKNIYDSLQNNELDEAFEQIFNDMLVKAEINLTGLKINPLTSRPIDIMNEIMSKTQIKNPSEAFQFTITEDSKSCLQEQIRLHEKCINQAVQNQEYQLVLYKMDQLKLLIEILKLDFIEINYKHCKKQICSIINQNYQDNLNKFNKIVENANKLSIQDIKSYQNAYDNIKQAEILRKDHLQNRIVSAESMNQNLELKVKYLVEQLSTLQLDQQSIDTNLGNLKLICENYPIVSQMYQVACQNLYNRFDRLVKLSKQQIEQNDFKELAQSLDNIRLFIALLQNYLDLKQNQKIYGVLVQEVKEELKKNELQCQNILKQEQFLQQDIAKLIQCQKIQQNFIDCIEIRQHINESRQINESFYKNFVSFVQAICDECIRIKDGKDNDENQFKKIQLYFNTMDQLRQIPEVDLRISELYHKCILNVTGYIIQVRAQSQELLKQFKQDPNSFDYGKVLIRLKELKSVQWMDNHKPGLYEDTMKQLSEELRSYQFKLFEQLQDLEFNLKVPQSVVSGFKIIEQSDKIRIFEQYFDEMKKYREDIQKRYDDAILKNLEVIENQFKGNVLDVVMDSEITENSLIFIKTCNGIKKLKDLTQGPDNLLRKYLNNFRDSSNQVIEDSTEQILSLSEDQSQNLFTYGQKLQTKLREVLDTQKYSNLSEYVRSQEILKNARQLFIKKQQNLRDSLENFDQTQAKAILQRVRVLAMIDEYVEGDKFFDLYREFQSKAVNEFKQDYQNLVSSIINHKFASFRAEFFQIDEKPMNQRALNQIKHLLAQSINELLEQVKTKTLMLGRNLKMEEIQTIVIILKKLKEAKSLLFNEQFLSKDVIDVANKELLHIQTLLTDRISKSLQEIEAQLAGNDFYEAEEARDRLNGIFLLLSDYIYTHAIQKKVDNLQEKIEKMVDEACDKYNKMPICDYIYDPPRDILEKLKNVSVRSQQYAKSYRNLSDKIIWNVQQNFKRAKEAKNQGEKLQIIQETEGALFSLSENMKQPLMVGLNDIKTIIKQDEENFKKDYERVQNNTSIQDQVIFMQKCKDSGMYNLLKPLQDNITEKARQIQDEIFRQIEDEVPEKFKNSLTQFYQILNYQKNFGDGIEQINKIFTETKDRLTRKYNQYLQILVEIEKNNNSDLIDQSFEILNRFLEANKKIYDINPEYIFKDQQKFDQFQQNMSKYFGQHFKNYKEAVDNYQIESLSKELKFTKQWQYFLKKVLQFCEQNTDKSIDMGQIYQIVKNNKNYQEMVKEVSNLLKNASIDIQNYQPQDLQENEREKYYKLFEIKMIGLKQAHYLKDYIDEQIFDVQSYELCCQPKIQEKIQLMAKQNKELFSAKNVDYDLFRLNFNNLITLEKYTKNLGIEVKQSIENVKNLVISKVIDIKENAEKKIDETQVIADSLIQIQIIGDGIGIPQIQEKVRSNMQQLLDRIKNKLSKQGGNSIALLSKLLEENQEGVGKAIISEYNFFKGHNISLFNSETQKHGIDFVLQNIEGEDLDKDKLRQLYQSFDTEYKQLVEKYLVKFESKKHTDDELFQELINLTKQVKHAKIKDKQLIWDASVKQEIPSIMARVFALWTLKNNQFYKEMDGVENRQAYLMQPHAGQIVSIYRVLGMGYKKGTLCNNLVQIGTGEGKSVTLALTSCILALHGVDIYCACYSETLSIRDYQSFLDIFVCLGLKEMIHYGTFNQLCEQIINEQCNIRSRVVDLIESNPNSKVKPLNNRLKILLIDEVDVFFSQDFYGNLYTPLARLRSQEISNMTNYLWKNRQEKLTLSRLEKTQEYKNLITKYTQWSSLIKEAIKDMLQDLQSFDHDYLVQDDKIGYREQDGVSFTVVYGYKTMFAYYQENDNGKITKGSLNGNIYVGIHCGSFSFAEIPHSFSYIVGVTGTLQTLSNAEKKIVQNDYKVKVFTYMPSVFGSNKRKFAKEADVYVENKDDYYKIIVEQISNKVGKQPYQRACLVFFESIEKLQNFYNSAEIAAKKQQIKYITEETTAEDQAFLIKSATNAGQITLLTKVFGRGVDFIVRDHSVISNGGIHVLQTFLSEELSEEVQIMGRTARQGKDGSFNMVLLDEDLEKYLKTSYKTDLQSMREKNSFYPTLDTKRKLFFDEKYNSTFEMILNAQKENQLAQQFKQHLIDANIPEIKKFLEVRNQGAPEKVESKTICLMDATGSMSSLLQKAKNTVGKMFENACLILEEHKLPKDCFQLQFAVYRDYDSKKEELFQFSTWETKPEALRQFMEKVAAKGGGDYEESIEIGLLHCNLENDKDKISQVILIGDAPAKEQSAIDRDRKNYGGEDYWIKANYPNTYYKKELEKLKTKKIPVHSFYLAQGAKANFEEISKQTGGQSVQLNIDSQKGSEILTQIVTEKILASIGEQSGKGNDLVESYRKKFGRAHG